MVISHEYKYLFIEVPLTASWAIRNELCEYYQGISILHKHATYAEFRRIASKDQLSYYIFATVRNPLDNIVSSYFKLLMDHKGTFSNPESVQNLVADYSDIKKYQAIKQNNLDFEGYFLKYCRRPYTDMADLSGDKLDFVIRYEDLQKDFSIVLQNLEIKQERSVPVTNKTQGKDKSFVDYYTPRVKERAKRVCGPYMKKWGYDFPPGWGDLQPSKLDEIRYRFFKKLNYMYMVNFRYSNSFSARAIRQLRAATR